MSARLDVILLGPPGAGKGTQATLLARRAGLAHLSTGDLLRQAIAAGSELGQRVKQVVESGRLVEDGLVLALVEERLGAAGSVGVLLDGFPRTVAQATMLAATFRQRGLADPIVIEIRIPDALVVSRLTSRKTCPACGPRPAGESSCGACGAALTVRADDSESVVRERLRVYAAQTAPLTAHYQALGLLRPVDGVGSPEDVASQIATIVAAARRRGGSEG